MRIQFITILFFLLIASASAEPEKLDDRWVYYGDTYEKDDRVYFVEESGNIYKLLLYVEDEPFILTNGSCKDDLKRDAKYCIVEGAYDDEERFDDYIKYESGERLYGFHLITYTLVPELEVTRTIRETKPDVNEQTVVTVTLENLGEESIKNIVYTEAIPETLTIQPIDGSILNGNYTYELGLLAPGKTKVFQYRVTPLEYVSISLQPSVTYVYEFQRKEATVTKLTLALTEPYTVTRTKSGTTFGINEQGTYSLKITNKEDESLDYTATVTLPDGMIVSDLNRFKQEGNTLTAQDIIHGTSSRQMSFTFRTPLTGEYVFPVEVTGELNGVTVTNNYEEKFTTQTQKLEPRIVFSRSDNKIVAGNTATLSLYLINNEPDSSYVNVKGSIMSDFLTEEITADVVVPGEEQLIKEISLVAPIVETTTNKEFVFSGTYETRQGEQFTFEKKQVIAIEPTTNLFVITHEPNVTSAHPGDAIKMTVTAKNIATRYLFVTIDDLLPAGIKVMSGTTYADISMEKDQTRELYLYEFVIPEDYPNENLTITTRAQEAQSAFMQEHSSTITITEEIIEEQETEETEAPAQETTEEEGILTRAWNWIKGWFT